MRAPSASTARSRSSTGAAASSSPRTRPGGSASRCSARSRTTRARFACPSTSSSGSRSSGVPRASSRARRWPGWPPCASCRPSPPDPATATGAPTPHPPLTSAPRSASVQTGRKINREEMVLVKRWYLVSASMLAALALVAAGCGSSSKKSTSTGAGGGAKGGTLTTVANAAPSGSPDPQVNYTLQEWQLLILSHDGLVGFKRASGTAGTKLVADLAESVPKPTNGGKTWAFKLRSGIKCSNGQKLAGKDVKATFERLFKIGNSPNAGTWYNVIEGADACIKTPKTCSLSKGITVNGDTVTFHLTTSDPEFLDKLAVPFAFILPASTPAKNVNIPPPGTGPYKWVQYNAS